MTFWPFPTITSNHGQGAEWCPLINSLSMKYGSFLSRCLISHHRQLAIGQVLCFPLHISFFPKLNMWGMGRDLFSTDYYGQTSPQSLPTTLRRHKRYNAEAITCLSLWDLASLSLKWGTKETSLAVQWLRFHCPVQRVWVRSQRAKIPHALQQKKKKKKKHKTEAIL